MSPETAPIEGFVEGPQGRAESGLELESTDS